MSAPHDDDVDLAALERWLVSRGLPSDITAAERIGGGTQNIVLRLTIDGEECVLRHPPARPRPHSNRAIAREMRVLAALHGTDVPHPALVAGSSDPRALGGSAFYLMESIAGSNPGEHLPPAYSSRPDWVAQACASVVQSLASLGSLSPAELGLGDLDRSEGFLERQIANSVALWKGMVDTDGYDPAELGDVVALAGWLESRVPGRSQPGIVHGDFQLNNVLLELDRPALAAIIDWEMCTVGDPLLDLGWLLVCWPGEDPAPLPTGAQLARAGAVPSRAEMVAVYAQHSDRDTSAIDWYVGLAALKLAVLLETTFVRSLRGDAAPEIGARLHRHAVDVLRTGREMAAGGWSLAR